MGDRYCVLGNPVEHSRSPWIHTRFAQLTGQDIAYGKRLIDLDGFQTGIDALAEEGYSGCNVTVPFKTLAHDLAHRVTSRATLARAANVLWRSGGRWHADNTDGLGLVKDITRNFGLPIFGARVLLIGAGGAAAGALGPLLACQPDLVVVCNRSASKADVLVEQHSMSALHFNATLRSAVLIGHGAESSGFFNVSGEYGPFDIAVNATSSSLLGQPLLLQPQLFAARCLAYDMMYGSAAEGFLHHAALCGAQTRDGLGMLVEQAGAAFEIWRGLAPPTAQVLHEMKQAYSAQMAKAVAKTLPLLDQNTT